MSEQQRATPQVTPLRSPPYPPASSTARNGCQHSHRSRCSSDGERQSRANGEHARQTPPTNHGTTLRRLGGGGRKKTRDSERGKVHGKPSTLSPRTRRGGAAWWFVGLMVARPCVFTFRRTMVQTRKRGHSAVGGTCYRFGLAAQSRFPGKDGAPREFDYTRRHGIDARGCKLPAGADESWSDPLTWAHCIEEVDYRSNSRQFRDDVLGIPREMIEAGQAEAAVAAYAQKIAAKWKTPVHWVIHDADGPNPHAHVLYAGRALDGPNHFARKRDREQDQTSDPSRGRQSITELHSQFWIETAAEFGYELDFSAQGEQAQAHIGPKAWSNEKKAIEQETAAVIAEAVNSTDPLDAGDLLKAAKAATHGLTVTEALAMDREPVTNAFTAALAHACDLQLHEDHPLQAPAPTITPDRVLEAPTPSVEPGRPLAPPLPAIAATLHPLVPELREDLHLEAPAPSIEPERPLAPPEPDLRPDAGFDFAVWLDPLEPISVPEQSLSAPTPMIAEALARPGPELAPPLPALAAELHPPMLHEDHPLEASVPTITPDRALEAPTPNAEPGRPLAPPLPMIAPAFDLPVPELHEDYALEEAPMPTIEPDRPLAAPTPELRDETGFDIAVWISPPDPIVVPERWLPAPTPTIAEALTTPAPELVLALPLSSPVPVIATELHPPALKLREDRALEAPAPRVEPEHALAPPLPVIAHRLPTPPHIEQERRLKEAAEFEAKRREARETAAYDRLTGALTADTAQAAGEALIESKAGHASAHPWIPGIGRQASARAVTELEKHVQRFHIAKRHRRKIGMSTRETTRYLDAVKDAIEGWRRWWTHTGLFGGESRGEGIVRELGRAVWPTHWQETEEEDCRITEKLKGERDQERVREQRERNLSQYRPRLVETEPSRKSKKGSGQGHTGGGGIGS